MTPLFGLVFAVLATVLCWAAVTVTRAARGWLAARALRRRGDGDTVEIVRRPLRRLATYAALVVLAVPAGVYAGGGALPGPSGGGFAGGTVANATTFSSAAIFSSTVDLRGVIANSGVAACSGNWAGGICFSEPQSIVNSAATAAGFGGFVAQNTDATGYQGFVAQDNGGTVGGFFVQYNASFSDADLANKVAVYSVSKLITVGRSDDVAAGTAVQEWRDNIGASGVLLMDVEGAGRVRPLLYGSQSNCSDGAGAAACSAAPAGSVVVDDGATTVVVSTTAVTANSQILLTYDSSLGAKLGVTCNTNIVQPTVSARTAATSFTITISADPATANPACISYSIVN